MFILLSFSTEVDINCCDVVKVRRPKLCNRFGKQDSALGRDELSKSIGTVRNYRSVTLQLQDGLQAQT